MRTSQSAVAAGTVGAGAAVARLVEALTDYDRTLLSELVWAPEPPTQRGLAERLGVHPVSVHRNLPRARARFAELLADPAHREVSDHADSLRQQLGPYLPAGVVEAELRRVGVERQPDRLICRTLGGVPHCPPRSLVAANSP